MLDDLALLGLGMALLVAGGNGFVSGASQLAHRYGISDLVIGLTVVAFGTSAPELAVNAFAALRGDTAIAFGNIVGSNIANVALVIGLCALLRPLSIDRVVGRREIPVMLVATLAALILGTNVLHSGPDVYGRLDGAILLLLFGGFLAFTFRGMLEGRDSALGPSAEAMDPAAAHANSQSVLKGILLATGGLAVLLLGAELTVAHAVGVAEILGVPEEFIALTIIACGTSLPELVTSVIATWKGQTNLAVGNVVGSNVFNLLFVLGATAAIQPVDVPFVRGQADLLVMTLFSVALLPLARSRASRIPRLAGGAFLICYVVYITWRLGG